MHTGWGAFTSVQQHPEYPELLLAGADVGGLFVSRDRGLSWSSCSRDLRDLRVFSICFVPMNASDAPATDLVPLVSTNVGVYRATSFNRSKSCLWEFRKSNTGILAANSTTTDLIEHTLFAHPVHLLECPHKSRFVYAALGTAETHGPVGSASSLSRLRFGDPWSVYVSHNAGVSWRGILRFPAPVIVEALGADPIKPERVGVASTLGVYLCNNSLDSPVWRELGVFPGRTSTDGGQTFQVANQGCHGFSGEQPTSCLPITSSENLTHPNARDITLLHGRVYVLLFDRGSSNETCSGSIKDPDLHIYRGGPFVSFDDGYSFSWLMRSQKHKFQNVTIRCAGVAPQYHTFNWVYMAIDPHDPEHMLFGGIDAAQGLYELDSHFGWRMHTTCGHSSPREYGQNMSTLRQAADCWEGGLPDMLQRDFQVSVLAFAVAKWTSHASLQIRNGEIISWGNQSVQGRPELLFTSWRGVYRAVWDPSKQRYSFDSLSDRFVSFDGTATSTWNSTGLGDPCVYAAVKPMLEKDGMVLACADGGIATTPDGKMWQRRSSTWASEAGKLGAGGKQTSQVQAMVQDYMCIWASHWNAGEHRCSVWESCDGYGRDWRVLGGWAPANGTDNGLRLTTTMVSSLAVDYSRTPRAGGRRLLQGAAEGAIFHYDPDRPQPQWKMLAVPPASVMKHDHDEGHSFPSSFIACVTTSQNIPDVAYVARGSDILSIHLAVPTTSIPTVSILNPVGGDPIAQPRALLQISPSELLAGAASDGNTVASSHDRLALLRGTLASGGRVTWRKMFSPLDAVADGAPEAKSLTHMFFSGKSSLHRFVALAIIFMFVLVY